ncbi:glycosyltransferase family 4 protein [Chloroflexota bacterium]
MKICLLGEYSGHLDEAMRKISFHLAGELSKPCELVTLDIRDIRRKRFWSSLANFDPQIIQYSHGPSLLSLVVMRMIGLYLRRAKTVIYATHPGLSILARGLIPLLKPDLVLTLSYETERMFASRGCKTVFLPAGVDVDKFRPVSTDFRMELRDKYGLDRDKFIVLHIGSIKKGRNAPLLAEIQGGSNQVIVVGATSTGVEQDVLQQLRRQGCLVWAEYFENIEDIYALSDCYIFPTIKKSGSIELPLSVLEAMSCNLPVISTRFGGLPRLFEEGDGLFFVDEEMDFSWRLEKIKNGTEVRNREKVLPYSWEKTGDRLQEIYLELMRGYS